MEKLVSIVLPVYNGSKYLKYSIESILNQTYKNWELIIVDDCSTDDTPRICKNYAEDDKRIKVIKNARNIKLPSALNKGFEFAKGEYFTWTSDDNMYKENAVEKMAEFLDNSKDTDLVCTSFDIIPENFTGKNDEIIETRLKNKGDSQFRLAFGNNVGACFMYRKNAAKNIKYDKNLFCAEDYDYWCKIALKGKISYMEDNLYFYRQNPSSLTATKKDTINKNTSKVLVKYSEKLMKKAGLKRKERAQKLLELYHKRKYPPLIFQACRAGFPYLFTKFAEHIFSAKNRGTHKVFTIFGIKISFKRCKTGKREKLNKKGWEEIGAKSYKNTVQRVLMEDYSCQTKEILNIVKHKSKCLEIACGSGMSSLTLSYKKECDCTVLDYSKKILENVTNCASKLNLNIKTVCKDAFSCKAKDLFKEKEFDYIFHSGFLEHFSKKERVNFLKLWRPYCKIMVSMVPNAASIAYRTGKNIKEKDRTWEYGLETPLYSQIQDFIEAGYKIKAEYTIGAAHALNFLENSSPLKKEIEEWLRTSGLEDDCHQGYLLVTIGEGE